MILDTHWVLFDNDKFNQYVDIDEPRVFEDHYGCGETGLQNGDGQGCEVPDVLSPEDPPLEFFGSQIGDGDGWGDPEIILPDI